MHKGPKPAQSLWRAFDWEQLCRTLPSLESLAPRASPNPLVTVSRSLHPSNTVVIFANPALLRENLERLSNAQCIKLSGDGTFRLIQNGWVLLNLGVVTKHYAPASGRYAFRSTYHPLLFAIANKESEVTYKALFDAATLCAHYCLELDLPKLVGQYHCDWHIGEVLSCVSLFLKQCPLANRDGLSDGIGRYWWPQQSALNSSLYWASSHAAPCYSVDACSLPAGCLVLMLIAFAVARLLC